MTKPSELIFWENLASRTGLEYLPIPGAKDDLSHRLTGELSGYQVIVQPLIYSKFEVPDSGIMLLIRHSPPLDLELVQRKMRHDPEVSRLVGNFFHSIEQTIQIEDRHSIIWLKHDFKVQGEESVLAWRMKEVITQLAKYVKPLSKSVCEYADCPGHADGSTSRLVFINGFPTYIHSDCIPRLQQLGEKNRQYYRETPSGLTKFFLAGLGIVLVAGLLYTVITYFASTIAILLFPVVPSILMRLRTKLLTKITLPSSVFAVGFSLLNVVWSEFLRNLWKYWERLHFKPFYDLLRETWGLATTDNKILSVWLVFVLLFSIYIEISIGLKTRQELSSAFKPTIEIYQPQASDKT